MMAREIEASQLQAGHTYRDDLGNYREVRSIATTRAHVVVTTHSGRFVFHKDTKVRVIDPLAPSQQGGSNHG
jgi:hypothetical protein